MLPSKHQTTQGDAPIFRTTLILLVLFLSACTKKSSEVEAFCSTMNGSHVQIDACHWDGKILMNVSDKRSGASGKPMVVWSMDAKTGSITMFNLPQKNILPNPLATQRDLLRTRDADLKLYIEKKKKLDTSIEKTEAIEGRSEKNTSFDKDCTWYNLVDYNPDENGRFDNVCIAAFDSSLVEGYMSMINSIKSLDQKHYPMSLEGLPILNWRMPFHKKDGWITKGHLPKVFVTGSPASHASSLHRMEFKYEIRKMKPDELNFKPDWK